MRRVSLLILITSFSISVQAQVYMEKQSRHRFAQLNFGVDLQTNFGGNTSFINQQNEIEDLSLGMGVRPRLVFGGTHFWGHADFYVAFPLYHTKQKTDGQTIDYNNGVETVFKWYPWRVENKKWRPFVGTGFSVYSYEQSNSFDGYNDGPDLNFTRVPLLTGLTYNRGNQLFEVGLSWNYQNSHDYYISQTEKVAVNTPPVHLNFSYRLQLETTLSAEKNWESGRTEKVTKYLEDKGRLNSLFVGVGFSSLFWLSESDYITDSKPYMAKFPVTVLPEFAIGYYLHKPDLNISLNYRGVRSESSAYGTELKAGRRSVGLEFTKALFDYHGFVPFVGPIVSWENLSFEDRQGDVQLMKVSDDKLAYGITFGWDIRPNRLQAWILRTNLRWYPNLNLETGTGRTISFDSLEFNFIELIVYPGRMF